MQIRDAENAWRETRAGTHFDSSLQRLDLDARRFQKTIRLHVHHLTGVTVHTERMLTLGVLSLILSACT